MLAVLHSSAAALIYSLCIYGIYSYLEIPCFVKLAQMAWYWLPVVLVNSMLG